jgi:hypothetical protein
MRSWSPLWRHSFRMARIPRLSATCVVTLLHRHRLHHIRCAFLRDVDVSTSVGPAALNRVAGYRAWRQAGDEVPPPPAN